MLFIILNDKRAAHTRDFSRVRLHENNHLCGDCVKDLQDEDKDIQVTPMPCGVGLLTRLTLLENIIKQKERITNE